MEIKNSADKIGIDLSSECEMKLLYMLMKLPKPDKKLTSTLNKSISTPKFKF